MSERINIGSDSSPEAIFLRSVLEANPKVKTNKLYADVELLVNNTPVLFACVIQAFEKSLDAVVQARAEALVSESALKPLADALRDAKWKVRAALAELPHPKGDHA